jgi:S1-C subfamily serine protease
LFCWFLGLAWLVPSLEIAANPHPGQVHGATRPALTERIAMLYEKVAPTVVGLTCRRPNEVYFGTGTIIDPRGLVVTSTTVIPEGATNVRVYLKGGRVLPGKPVLIDEDTELSLLRIEGSVPEAAFAFVELGHSGQLRLGELALTFGNAFQSIQNDDQISLGKGIISGFYDLDETFSQSKYTGRAIETSAPLNSGADGGPLIDHEGKLVGILSLNYSRSRWLGTAVPVDALKPFLWKHLAWFHESQEPLRAHVGWSLQGSSEAAGVNVSAVEPGGPAAQAGVRPGDRLVELDGEPVADVPQLRERLRTLGPGATVRLKARRGEEELQVEVRSWGRL